MMLPDYALGKRKGGAVTIKAGICGFGGLGRVHANSLTQMRDVEVVAVCDGDPERLKAKEVKFNVDAGQREFDITPCRTYTDFRVMRRKENLDVLVTALPTDLHAPIATAAMASGWHVFSEKPMALTVKECDRMIAARDRNKRQLMIGQCLRFWPEYEVLRQAVQRRTYGRLISLTMERISGYSNWTAGGWMNIGKRSGGAVLDLHLHDVDWARYVLGQPRGVYACGYVGKSGAIDDITALWDYDDGMAVALRSSWMYAGFTMNFRAMFEDAVMEYGFPPDTSLRLNRRDGKDWEKVTVAQKSGYFEELRYFIDCVNGKQSNTVCSAESTRDTVVLVWDEKKSIRKGKRVRTA